VPAFLILGCGYVGTRVARRLLARGAQVHATSRDPATLGAVAARGAVTHRFDTSEACSVDGLAGLARDLGPGLRVLVSVPPPGTASQARRMFRALAAHPARVVLLSTTSVYGAQLQVDERTAPASGDEASRARLAMERIAAAGPWTTLVLRCAAIYGPGRGIHVALRDGRAGRVRDPDRIVSRVHVEDLASVAVAALWSEAGGAWPVADDEPATTREVAAFCEGLGLPGLPAAVSSRRGVAPGRRVDGGAVRRLLGVPLRYPSYREGISAAIERARETD
jgi:nucleoside-diphosphate-sugar epimerase